MNPGPNQRERGQCTALVVRQPREVMDDFSLCFEETLTSLYVLPRGFSTSLLQLAFPRGLGCTFGDSEDLAGAWGRGQAPRLKQDLANHILSRTAAGLVAVLGARWPCWCGPSHDTAAWAAAGGRGRTWPGFCCHSRGCRRDAGSRHTAPRCAQPRCNRVNPRRASRRQPPLPTVEGEFKHLQKSRWCAQPSAIIICATSCFLPRAAFILHCFPLQVGLQAPHCSASGAASATGSRATLPAAACCRRGHLCLPARPPSSSCQSYFWKQQLSPRIVNCSSTPFQPS